MDDAKILYRSGDPYKVPTSCNLPDTLLWQSKTRKNYFFAKILHF